MSVDGLIGDAIVTALRVETFVVTPADPPTPAVNLPDASIVRSKTPSLPPKTNPPKIVVVVGDRPSKVERLTATEKLSYWPCSVVVFAGGGSKQDDDERSRTWRGQIERKVFDQDATTFASVTGFNGVAAAEKSAFDPAALDKDLAALTSNFEVQVIEDL